MKKLFQKLFCYTERTVRDVNTGKLETATYTKIFGFVVRTKYGPLVNKETNSLTIQL